MKGTYLAHKLGWASHFDKCFVQLFLIEILLLLRATVSTVVIRCDVQLERSNFFKQKNLKIASYS